MFMLDKETVNMRALRLSNSHLPEGSGSASHTSCTPDIRSFPSSLAKKPSDMKSAMNDAASTEHVLFERNLRDKSKSNPQTKRKRSPSPTSYPNEAWGWAQQGSHAIRQRVHLPWYSCLRGENRASDDIDFHTHLAKDQ